MQVATVQAAVNDLLEVRPPEPVRPCEPLLLELNKVRNRAAVPTKMRNVQPV
ncbi:MAG: hypothetical protein OEW45_12535 [Deltaproteobacteria bacterium]|nr:hypothetical protein [Deltaproteobacteria bacterium]